MGGANAWNGAADRITGRFFRMGGASCTNCAPLTQQGQEPHLPSRGRSPTYPAGAGAPLTQQGQEPHLPSRGRSPTYPAGAGDSASYSRRSSTFLPLYSRCGSDTGVSRLLGRCRTGGNPRPWGTGHMDHDDDDDGDGVGWADRRRVKAGECPADVDSPVCNGTLRAKCNRDSRCDDKAKCCFSGCRNRCRLPLEDKNTMCPYFDASKCPLKNSTINECYSDVQCQGSERCCCFNCRRECTPTVRVKPGQCPAVSGKCPAVTPKPACRTDDDCDGSKKCCQSCGSKCLEPEKERQGYCPLSTENLSCLITPGKPQCRRDDDCTKNWKCCLSNNRMECVRPLKEKPGQCPASGTKCPLPAPKVPCSSDRNCHGGKKCCKLACGMFCSDPVSDWLV
uniref:WAP domain-containing protein n=1 Tax=Xenopus tropicalis TaxID=8364 RepID=A0A803J454_XENTR